MLRVRQSPYCHLLLWWPFWVCSFWNLRNAKTRFHSCSVKKLCLFPIPSFGWKLCWSWSYASSVHTLLTGQRKGEFRVCCGFICTIDPWCTSLKTPLYQWKTLFISLFIVFKISTLLVHVSADHPHIGGQKSSSCIANEFHDLWKTSAIILSSQILNRTNPGWLSSLVQYIYMQPSIICTQWTREVPRVYLKV